MPRRSRLFPLFVVSLGAAGLAALACAGSHRVTVDVDEVARTGWGDRSPGWDWEPDTAPWLEAPAGVRRDLPERLSTLVSNALAARGFVRARERPDYLVRYRLRVVRARVVTVTTHPPRSLTGSLQGEYVVSAVHQEVSIRDALRLELRVRRRADGRLLWSASLRERVPAPFEARLEELVTRLFERFPNAPSTTARR